MTPEQIHELRLAVDPDNPGKVQAEAIPPDGLAQIVQQAIHDRLDEVAWRQVMVAEEHAKAALLGRFGEI